MIFSYKSKPKKKLIRSKCAQYEEHYGELFGYNSDSDGINISDQETESEESEIEIEEYESDSDDDKEIEDEESEDDINDLEDLDEDNDEEDKFISHKIKKPKIIGKTKNNNDSWSDWESNKLTIDDETDNTYIIESMESDEDNLYNLNDLRVSMRQLFKKFSKDDEIINKLETGILDNVCEICDRRKIVKKWENINFKKIYLNKCRSIYTNLDTKSYIKNDYLITEMTVNPDISENELSRIISKTLEKIT